MNSAESGARMRELPIGNCLERMLQELITGEVPFCQDCPHWAYLLMFMTFRLRGCESEGAFQQRVWWKILKVFDENLSQGVEVIQWLCC